MRRASLPIVAVLGLLVSSAEAQMTACDLAAPTGTIDVADVQAAINMALKASPCTADIGGGLICNVAVVQRVINAALGLGCDTSTGVVPHSVTLTWMQSSSANVAGYRIYRATSMGGPYTAVNSSLVTGLTYTDYTVRGGVTYYYVARAVDSGGAESANSNEAPAAVVAP